MGSEYRAKQAGAVLLDAWPEAVAKPIAAEMQRVASAAQGGAITGELSFSVYFSTGAVESLRLGLNRAYGVEDRRSWWRLRLWSMLYVEGGAFSLLAYDQRRASLSACTAISIGFWLVIVNFDRSQPRT